MPLSPSQLSIVQAPQRFKVAICGRRWGKTTLAIREMCRIAAQPNKEIFYVSPTYRQSKMIAWRKLKNKLLDLRWVKKINESELSITLRNNSLISLKGADGGAQNLRGIGLDFVCLDEFALIDPEAWYEVLRPALSDKMGSALFISTPAGMNWAKDLFDLQDEFPDEWRSFQYTSLEGGNIPPEEIEAARRTLDIRTFKQEYEASWQNFSGRCYYAFDRKQNLKAYTGELPREIHIGIDFNVDPITAAVFIKLADNKLHMIDELRIFGSNTDELAKEILERYPRDRHSIICYPDPAGAQRKTSAGGQTDHTILRQAGFRVLAPHSHNSVKDGINAVNAKLCSSTGIIGLYVDPRCKYAIECFEKYAYKEGTSQPDKSSGFDHLADAIRYAIDYLAPIRLPQRDLPIRSWGHKLEQPRQQQRTTYGFT
jgi:Terminase large subunit, T4likevirus-type, N-terminal/Terminase RNaseH-like domain